MKRVSRFPRLPPLNVNGYAETLLEDKKYQALREFTRIYGIGPTTAQTLYARKCRNLKDVKKFFDNPDNTTEYTRDEEDNDYEDKNKDVPERWIVISLNLKDDLSIK